MNKLILLSIMFFTINSSSYSIQPIYDINISNIDGNNIDLNQFKGKYILFVNVASKCGFTNQYKDLEILYNKFKDKLVIIGLPCNQFGNQEPENENNIKTFCQKNYGVTFILTEKIDVKGKFQHPIYSWLTKKKINGQYNSNVKWNFQKYLVDREGKLINYFYSTTKPLNDKITSLLR